MSMMLWTKTADRMPQKNTLCLLAFKGEGTAERWDYDIGSWDGEYWFDQREEPIDDEVPTYWAFIYKPEREWKSDSPLVCKAEER